MPDITVTLILVCFIITLAVIGYNIVPILKFFERLSEFEFKKSKH